MGKIIGIDLGTTNSVVAVLEGGEPKVIANAEGGRTTPSIVAFKKDNERLIGAPAKRQAATNPKNTIYSIKRFMGRFYDEVSDETSQVPYEVVRGDNGTARIMADGRAYTPQEVSAMILQKLKQTAESYLGEEVREAVITVPAYFNDAQRTATKEAGTIAGLNVRRIINEPTAAALAYGMDKKDKQDHKIAVYDFGGGTYDISILELGHTEDGESVFEVISTNGDTHLGGDNLDQELVNYIADEFHKNEGIDLRNDAMALQRLREAAENAKKELSTSTQTSINLPFITATQEGPKHLTMDITRSKFEQLVDHLLQRTMPPMKKALEDAGVKPSEVDEVLLVGGSTRIPKVRDMVEKFFGRKPDGSVNPDEVVALGASIQGAVLNKEISDILLVDVTPLNLGIETLGGVTTSLIEANTTIPTKKSEVFSTASDSQTTVDIHVLQGNRPMAIHNRSLGRFFLDGIPPAPRGLPQIEVTFDIDADGILHVSAKDKATGKDKSIRIEASSGLTEQEIEKMRQAATEHAEEDQKAKEEIEKLNRADTLVFSTEKNIKEYGDKIPEEKRAAIESALAELKELHKNKTISGIDAAVDKLNEAWAAASEDMYKAQQEAAQQPPPEGGDQASHGAADDGEVKDADYEVVDEEESR